MRLTFSKLFHAVSLHFGCLALMSGLFWSDMASCETVDFYHAVVKYSYADQDTGSIRVGDKMDGTYGLGNRPDSEEGQLIHVRTEQGENHGCSLPTNVPPNIKWIALIQRGGCKFNYKIYNAAIMYNASAVIVYNHEDGLLITMQHEYGKSLFYYNPRIPESIYRICCGKYPQRVCRIHTRHMSSRLASLWSLVLFYQIS